ncbi:MAG: ABC transporter permease, partial [Paracoccaceae bacterium]
MAMATETFKGRRRSPFLSTLKRTVTTLFTIAVTMLGLLFVTFFIGRVMPVDPVLS